MKLKIVSLMILNLLLGSGVFAQNGFHRFISGTGHELKRVFTELKDPEWAAVVTTSSGAAAYDSYTTCDGFNHGLVEQNPIYGHTNSCVKLNVIGASLELTGLVLDRYIADKWVQKSCDEKARVAADPNAPQWLKNGWANSNCGRSKHAMWVWPILTVPAHIALGISNERLISK